MLEGAADGVGIEKTCYQSGRHVLKGHPASDQLTRQDSQTVDVRFHTVAMKILHEETQQQSIIILYNFHIGVFSQIGAFGQSLCDVHHLS